MKKLTSMLLVIVTLLSLALPCSAVAFPEGKQPIVNVSTTDPMNGIALLEATYPTATHHMHSQGSLPFSGNAAYTMLYLNAMVFDCSTYIIDIYNVGDNTLHCTVRRQYSGDYEVTVEPHSYRSIRVYASPTEILCLSFNPPSNFSGMIRCGCNS